MRTVNAKHGTFWVRDYNKKKLYNLIRENQGISRVELTKKIDLTPTSVGKIISILMEEGLVEEQGLSVDGKIGRNAIRLQIVPDRVLALALEIDVDVLKGAVVNISGETISTYTAELPTGCSEEQAVDAVLFAVQMLMEGLSSQQRDNIIGIGIAAPGHIDRVHGIIRLSPQLDWREFPLLERLQARLPYDLDIVIDNNIKAEAMAECIFGTAAQFKSALILDFGSGLGSAYISDGRIQPGSHNSMGEIGHILVGSNGIKCSCGRYGCLRTHIARTSIEQRTGLDIRSTVEAARNGDPICSDVLNEAVRYTCIWLANAINLYDPSVIYLGGALLQDWPEFYGRVTEGYRQYVWETLRNEEFSIQRSYVSQLDHSIISAASIVFYKYLLTGVQINTNR